MTNNWTASHATAAGDDNPRNHWATPNHFIRELERVTYANFGLDAAALESNKKAPAYLGPDNPNPSMRDAFDVEWYQHLSMGKDVWLNPPYGRDIGRWVELAATRAQEEGLNVYMLIFARTDTRWWWRHVLGRDQATGLPIPRGQRADRLYWVPGRIRFVDPTGKAKGSAPAPSVVVRWAGFAGGVVVSRGYPINQYLGRGAGQ